MIKQRGKDTNDDWEKRLAEFEAESKRQGELEDKVERRFAIVGTIIMALCALGLIYCGVWTIWHSWSK